ISGARFSSKEIQDLNATVQLYGDGDEANFACRSEDLIYFPAAFPEAFRVGWKRTMILRSSRAPRIRLKPRRANLPGSGRVLRIDSTILTGREGAVSLPNLRER